MLRRSLAVSTIVFSQSVVAQQQASFVEKDAIRWALTAMSVKHSKSDSEAKLAQLLASTTSAKFGGAGLSAKSVSDAFEVLQPCRVKRSHNDLSIAAAEHYMFMRMRAGATGDLMYRVLPGEYLKKKIEKIADGTVKDLQTTEQPVSPPSEDVRRWGEAGVEAGLVDYKRLNGKEPAFGIDALAEGALFVIGAKFMYPYTEKRPCTISLQ